MKIVTALYELFRTLERGHYKAFREGLLLPFLDLPKEGIQYIIYTDKATYDKFNLAEHLNHPSYEVRFKELTTSEFSPAVNAIKKRYEANPDHYNIDKHLCVFYYMELMFEKFNFVLENTKDDDEVVMWLDAGLFFNSCNFPWRGWVYENMSQPAFFQKLHEILQKQFTILISNWMGYHYELYNSMNAIVPQYSGANRIISGGLWGGPAAEVKELVKGFKENCQRLIGEGHLVSDQECISLEYMKDPAKFQTVEFGDWYDYQICFLKMMDLYDPNNYDKEKCHLCI